MRATGETSRAQSHTRRWRGRGGELLPISQESGADKSPTLWDGTPMAAKADSMNHFLDESPRQLLVRNVAMLDIPKRNRKEAKASRADNFEALCLMVNAFGSVWDSREDHDRRPVLLVATNAGSELSRRHRDIFSHWWFRITTGFPANRRSGRTDGRYGLGVLVHAVGTITS